MEALAKGEDVMEELKFRGDNTFVSVEKYEGATKGATLGWISREPNAMSTFSQSLETNRISFEHMSAIYAKMVAVELNGVSDDYENEVDKLQSQLAARDALIERLVEGRLRPDESGNPTVFQRKDGSWGASYEVTAETVRFLTPKGEENGAAVDEEYPF